MTVSITDKFDNTDGKFVNYDAYDPTIRGDIRGLKHRDLRSLRQADVSITEGIWTLNLDSMTDLNLIEVGSIGSDRVVTEGEHWTGAGTVAIDASRQNFPVLTINCTGAGTFVTDSTTSPIDLLSDFVDTDQIQIALPAFPATSVDLSASTLTLGDGTNIQSVAFGSAHSIPSPPSSPGNSTAAYLRSQFSGIDLSHVTLVRLTIVATAACAVKVMAVRLLAASWQVAGVDMDTRLKRLRRTAPWDGDVTAAPDFTQPTLWRSDDPPGIGDPRPIDTEVSALIYTGSMASNNQLQLFFREVTEDFMTQLDLDGEAMGVLDGHDQPDLGENLFTARIQTDMEGYSQDQIDPTQQYDLERSTDSLAASWIQVNLQWGPTTSLVVENSESNGPTLTAPALTANTQYALLVTVEENSVQVRIYDVDDSGNVGTEVYDSGVTTNDFWFKRRRGRFGWYANLIDGDTYVDSIQARSLNFNEYRSAPVVSNTPVIGAELFASTSPNIEQFQAFGIGPNNNDSASVVVRDSSHSTSGNSWRIDSFGTAGFQGLQSNLFELDDFDNTEVEFDIFYPVNAAVANALPRVYLQDEKQVRLIGLPMPTIIPGQWQRLRFLLSDLDFMLGGRYSLVIVQQSAFQASWWVDSPTISTRSVVWDGRAIIEDAWASNTADTKWVPFRNTLNRQGGGITFAKRGSQLQIRARASRQDGSISRVQIIPKYAELGRIVS